MKTHSFEVQDLAIFSSTRPHIGMTIGKVYTIMAIGFTSVKVLDDFSRETWMSASLFANLAKVTIVKKHLKRVVI